jgi:ribosomal protein L16 Arg81 hydroxylase
MFDRWIREVTAEEFLETSFGRTPVSMPSVARSAIPFLTWETIEQLIDSGTNPDMLVVRNGKLRDEKSVTTFAAARELFRDGWSLVLRRCERHDPRLRLLADAFEAALPGEVSIQIYATPATYQSFSWHYDCEDVFIAQTGGVKEYFLRENTVNPRPRLSAMPRDMQAERETSPAMAATLIPGDWLYIPRGWWHVARSIESSLSISVGVLAPDAR